MQVSRLRGLIVTGLLAGALAAWPSHGSAQYGQNPDTDTRFYVAPSATRLVPDEDTFEPDDATGVRLALGKTFVKQVAMELYAFHYNGIDLQRGSAGSRADNTGIGFNVLLFPMRDVFPVFGIVGIGEGSLETDGGFDEDSEFVDLGIGFLLPLADWIDLRGEYRFRSSDVQYPTGSELDVRSDVMSLGVQVPFGSR